MSTFYDKLLVAQAEKKKNDVLDGKASKYADKELSNIDRLEDDNVLG